MEPDQILRCQSENTYTFVYLLDGTKLLITKSLRDFENLLADHGFLRTHQSHLVNRKYIRSLLKKEGESLQLVDGSVIPISIRQKTEVLAALK